jgi:basic amino acid/polyamine antiporter, APA family
VTQTGGMAAVAVTFANYFISLTHAPVSNWVVAVVALATLTAINCFGVRTGSSVQSVLMVMKIFAVLLVIVFGLGYVGGWGPANNPPPEISQPAPAPFEITALGAALIPVLFSYGGWQTSSFIAGEMRDPRKDLPRGLLIGVMGVIFLYLLVNYVYVYVLGVDGLAGMETPASEVMRLALGEKGKTIIAIGITISTLGFLSQGMLTAPRVYFAMAEDRLFFKSVAWVHPRTRVPVVAIALQGVLAIMIALSGTYDQILNYVVSVDSIFFGLAAACIFVFRRKGNLANKGSARTGFRVPGHPFTTILFIVIEWLVAVNTFYKYPENSMIGMAIMLAGIPVYFFWLRSGKR